MDCLSRTKFYFYSWFKFPITSSRRSIIIAKTSHCHSKGKFVKYTNIRYIIVAVGNVDINPRIGLKYFHDIQSLLQDSYIFLDNFFYFRSCIFFQFFVSYHS